ncbi:tlde1 domain-containing protein [Sphingomonas bacterium]|uniref:tlde1 domain-containing protein n=1 Tax=Sphingomonas bacterium TaxID=1895847 RepID=UPI001576BEFA|nr:tlde1 domain-containing protein [Sphingomonas bacterium]
MPWRYQQSTGVLTHNGQRVTVGYSGAGTGRNNHAMQATANVGPIPTGNYTIGTPYNTTTHGPHVMRLTPQGHTALGRSGFLIHGDNRTHTASQGCVILDPNVRNRISASRDLTLEVVQ